MKEHSNRKRMPRGAVCLALVTAGVLQAQRGGGDWMTIGNDAQRSWWIRGDAKIAPETMRKPGFELLWKLKLNNETRHLNAITPPALLDFYISYRGFRTLGFFGGSSDNVIGIDTDIARLEWERSLGAKGPRGGSALCPGGMTSSVTRPTFAAYPPAAAGRGAGRGNAAKSGVGEPLEGAVTLRDRPVQFVPPPTKGPNRRTAPPVNPFARNPLFVLAVTGDGKLHSLYVSNGEEPKPAVPFLPAGAHAIGLIAFDNKAYAATVNGCGGVANGIWAIDLESHAVTSWKAGANLAGTTGFAAGPEGVLYAAVGSKIVALDPGTLKEKGSYAASAAFTSSPLVFEHKGKDIVAASTADGSIHLLDADSMQALSTFDAGAKGEVGAMASWQDGSGTRWLLTPAGNTVAALKVADRGGKASLEPGWVSGAIASPLAPTIVNGVVFAVASGEFRGGDEKTTAAQRAQKSSKAVLYALDSATGKEFWNSGPAITSFVHSGGLAAGGGRVYVSAHDGTQYAFGFPMEH